MSLQRVSTITSLCLCFHIAPVCCSMGIVKLLNSWDEEPRCVRAVRSKLGVYYAQYGRFCACHPWEIIVSFVTLTVCILSMSIISGGKVAIPCTVGGGCKDVPPPQLVQDDKVSWDGQGAVTEWGRC